MKYIVLSTLLILSSLSVQASRRIPLSVTVKQVSDLRVKLNQQIQIGSILANKPPEVKTATGYTSQKHQREVEKQKRILAQFEQIVSEEELPETLIEHEQAKLQNLEFEAKEHQLASLPLPHYQETVYRSPVNGIVKRITPLSSNNGLLQVEIMLEIKP